MSVYTRHCCLRDFAIKHAVLLGYNAPLTLHVYRTNT
jgi:hypothetical protein